MSNSLEQTQDSRDKILKAAEELFSNKGFNGTSVNELAEKAGINKALIYYYFKNKEDILQYLFDNLIDDIAQVLIQDVIQESKLMARDSFFNDKFLEDAIIKYLDFFVKRRNIMRVMVAESLKRGANAFLLFKFTDFINSEKVKNITEMLEEKGIKVQLDDNSILVGKFFMGFIPMVNFAIYYDQWKEYYNMTDEEYKSTFINMYKMSYDGYKLSIMDK